MGIFFSSKKQSNTPSTSKESLLEFEKQLREKLSGSEREDPIDELSLRIEALWLLIKDKLKVDDNELADIINKLSDQDLEETAVKEDPNPCPKCGRPMSIKTNLCIYCGADEDTVAEALKKFEM